MFFSIKKVENQPYFEKVYKLFTLFFVTPNRSLSGYTKTKRRERINAFRGMRSALDNGGSHVCEPYKHCAESEICAFDSIVRLSLNVGIDGDKSYINFKEQISIREFCL